jgi:hypothetical protein
MNVAAASGTRNRRKIKPLFGLKNLDLAGKQSTVAALTRG